MLTLDDRQGGYLDQPNLRLQISPQLGCDLMRNIPLSRHSLRATLRDSSSRKKKELETAVFNTQTFGGFRAQTVRIQLGHPIPTIDWLAHNRGDPN